MVPRPSDSPLSGLSLTDFSFALAFPWALLESIVLAASRTACETFSFVCCSFSGYHCPVVWFFLRNLPPDPAISSIIRCTMPAFSVLVTAFLQSSRDFVIDSRNCLFPARAKQRSVCLMRNDSEKKRHEYDERWRRVTWWRSSTWYGCHSRWLNDTFPLPHKTSLTCTPGPSPAICIRSSSSARIGTETFPLWLYDAIIADLLCCCSLVASSGWMCCWYAGGDGVDPFLFASDMHGPVVSCGVVCNRCDNDDCII